MVTIASMVKTRCVLAASLLVLSAASASFAAQPIAWHTGPTAVTQSTPDELRAALTSMAARPDARHLVVQFDGPLGEEQRAAVEAAGLRMLSYVGNDSFFAATAATGVDSTALSQMPWMVDVMPIERSWRLHPAFHFGNVPEWAILPTDDKSKGDAPVMVAAYIVFHPDVVLARGEALVVQYGAKVRSRLESVNGLVIELPLDNVPTLADEDAVQWIEPPLPKFSELNNSNREITGANVVQAPPYNLTGTGVSVLVYDGGFARATHVDFGGRLTVRDTSGQSDHATHVSGTVGGSGQASSGTYRGMAPGVTIESYGFEQEGGLQEGFLYSDPGDLEADYNEAINVFGADISNNSIGSNVEPNGFDCEMQGNYGVTSALIDSIVRGSLGAPFRIVWASGNERQGNRCDVEGFGDYYSLAPPAGAKNHIGIGALNSNDDSMTSFSSWGPMDNGRLKPDVCAPGCQSNDDGDVTSCSSSSDTAYTGKCGTSMASPTVAGLSALILEDYRANYPGEPDFRNATLKAVLAHTAVDLGNPGPDYQFGYGSVRVQPAIDLMRAENFLEAEVSQGGTFSALIFVGAGDPAMKVTLAWDDLPGTPNVEPTLVNDLDLVVFNPLGGQHFPWTLDPLNPSAPAVQTQPDHLNNMEQVYVASPMPGAWRVEVHGFNVPGVSQIFSLAASPELINCSTVGVIALNGPKFACESTAEIQVTDCDLNTDDGTIEQVTVTIASDSEPAGETVVLTETAPEAAKFVGSIPLSATDGAGVLLIAHGNTVTATYIDADDGFGNTNVPRVVTAVVDCVAPVISNVQAAEVEPRDATITFNTDEPAFGTVRYGLSCGALSGMASGSGAQTAHSVAITGLEDNTTYYFAVEVEDQAGNGASDDNGGTCYSFTTPEVPDFFTEQFTSGNDMPMWSAMFTPNFSVDFYGECAEQITQLPTDPAGGTNLPLSDDGSQSISLSGGQTVKLYGVSYSSLYVNANGNLTFQSSDGDYTETLTEHFGEPRVSAFWDDLNPSTGGNVSWKQTVDRVAVTWQNVPEYSATGANTFQIEMFFDGRIHLSYLDMTAGDGIVGLSEGEGLSPDFFPTDHTASGACGPPDCDGNGIPDDQDIADCPGDPACSDCNGNSVPDGCDIDDGGSEDCDANGIPDECDIADCPGDPACDDCNGNGVPDGCDIAGPAPDCNANGIPDSCDSADCAGDPACDDCNGNGVLDGCDLAGGTEDDCDGNTVPDSCDLADCSGDPACDDCNNNSIMDGCDIAAGEPDDNGNGLLDECEIVPPLVAGEGSLYLAVSPQPLDLGLPVALHVTGALGDPDVACVSMYVQADGTLGTTAVYQTPGTWGTVHVHGAEIAPSKTFQVQAELDGAFAPNSGSAVTFKWGDVDDNGDANFTDIHLVVRGFQGDFSEASLEAVDLDPCIPDRDISFQDISKAVKAFQGRSYVESGCPYPCP